MKPNSFMRTIAVFLGSLILLSFQSKPTSSDEPETTRVAPTERLILAAQPVERPWNAADTALRDAMQVDPSYTAGSGEGLHQSQAIAAWETFLKRKDLTREQKVFAWWRIGSLAAHNFDSGKGEVADLALAESALLKVHKLAKDLISVETLNAATVYGGLPGKAADRYARYAKAYRWLFTRTEAMVADSAKYINHNGYVVDGRLMRGGMRLDTISKKRNFLRSFLTEHRGIISKRITEEIQSSDDLRAIEKMLKTIKGVGEPTVLKKWNAMLSDARSQAKQPPADNE